MSIINESRPLNTLVFSSSHRPSAWATNLAPFFAFPSSNFNKRSLPILLRLASSILARLLAKRAKRWLVPASWAPLRNFSLVWEARSWTRRMSGWAGEFALPPTDQPPSCAWPMAAFQVGRWAVVMVYLVWMIWDHPSDGWDVEVRDRRWTAWLRLMAVQGSGSRQFRANRYCWWGGRRSLLCFMSIVKKTMKRIGYLS